MRVLSRILVGVLIFLPASAPALAQDLFDAHYHSLATGSVEIGHIGYSDALMARSATLGETELARLSGYLRDDLQAALVRSHWHGMAARATVLDVTILDVTPNRPTISQIEAMDNLHYTMHATGGADLSAVLVDADGRIIASYDFSWYNPEPGDDTEAGIWTDTRSAFARFSRQLADSLGDAPMPRQISGSR